MYLKKTITAAFAAVSKEFIERIVSEAQDTAFDPDTFLTEESLSQLLKNVEKEVIAKLPNKKKGRKKRDGERGATNRWIQFCKEWRPKIKDKNPGANFTDVGRLLSAQWEKLSAADKEIYGQRAIQENKKRGCYKPPVAAQEQKEGGERKGDDTEEATTKTSSRTKRVRKKRVRKPKAKASPPATKIHNSDSDSSVLENLDLILENE